jgi:GNAT superfamily N-acetyltransferase
VAESLPAASSFPLDRGDPLADHLSSMMNVRRANPEDRVRILEISSQIWDGEDYVPELLDGWFSDHEGELAVALLNDHLIAFAHRTWLCPGIAWLEGIRTDPAWEGHGAGRAITEHFIRRAKDDGATRINLSTYIDNEASIHIIESYGFTRVATFSHVERIAEMNDPLPALALGTIRDLSEEETLEFVDRSQFLALAQRRFPRGWRFYPFDHDPREAIARLSYLGLEQDEKLKAVMCHGPDHEGCMTLNFLDGDPDVMRILLDRFLQSHQGKTLEMMVPCDQERHAELLPLLQEAGFTSWSEFKPDVFAYEMAL